MSTHTDTLPIGLGSGKAGLTLRAQLANPTSGVTIGSTITTGFTELGGGNYELALTWDDANGTTQNVRIYDSAAPTVLLATGQVSTSSGSSDPGETWYYADEQAVSDLIGAVALQDISNEPGAASATAVDSARVLRAGLWADQFMDGRLATLGYVTPLANMSAATRLLMKDASAKLVAWKLNEMRLLTTLSTGKHANRIDKIMEAHREAAESTLNRIAYRAIEITADRRYARPPYAKVFVPTAATELATRRARAIQDV